MKLPKLERVRLRMPMTISICLVYMNIEALLNTYFIMTGEESEDEEKKRVTEERLKAYAEKKAKKGPGPVAKSNVIYDVKPWYSF